MEVLREVLRIDKEVRRELSQISIASFPTEAFKEVLPSVWRGELQ
jgi:hypothetical protein